MTCKVHHRERAGAAMQPLFDRLEATLDTDCTVPEDGGNRDDAIQLRLWAKGRRVKAGCDPKIEANWEVVNQKQVVTHAFTAEDSAHGHCAGADVVPVRTTFANGMPATVWLGNETDPADRAEAVRLQELINVQARAAGYECGADWSADKRDGDHYQLPGWQKLPRFVAAV